MGSEMAKISLVDAPRKLAEFGCEVKYRRLYGAAIDNQIPAAKGDNSRWYLDESDLPAIARTFGSAETIA